MFSEKELEAALARDASAHAYTERLNQLQYTYESRATRVLQNIYVYPLWYGVPVINASAHKCRECGDTIQDNACFRVALSLTTYATLFRVVTMPAAMRAAVEENKTNAATCTWAWHSFCTPGSGKNVDL